MPQHTPEGESLPPVGQNRTDKSGIAESVPIPALRDAAALRQALRTVDRGEGDVIPTLAVYEQEMVDYAFRAVRESLRNMKRFHAQGSLQRAFTKLFFRTIDAVPPLKAAFFRR